MRRHEALADLSRDHQHALACALVLRRATATDAATAAERFLEFWRTEGRRHFQVEEEVLLPGYATYADPASPEVARVLVEHVALRRDAEHVSRGEVDAGFLNGLGERLEAHVRHEERVLFPMIEEALPDEELRALATRVTAAERSAR